LTAVAKAGCIISIKTKGGLVVKTRYWLLALVVSMLTSTTPVLADGDMYVVIAGGGGVGTKISSLPYTISARGFYYVTGNLTCASGNGITVNASDVTIDLMGFCLSGNSESSGIYLFSAKNVEIRNGTLRDWYYGIWGNGNMNACHRVINVRAEGNIFGIFLNESSHTVKGCVVVDNSSTAIWANNSMITGNQITNCTNGIFNNDGTSSNNVLNQCNGNGIYGSGIISGNMISNSGDTGIRCYGTVSINGNNVSNSAQTGIYCYKGATIIGNTIYCDIGQTGIDLSTDASNYILVDQNTVSGVGQHYVGSSSATIWGKNAGLP
jgi:hypothetical protein